MNLKEFSFDSIRSLSDGELDSEHFMYIDEVCSDQMILHNLPLRIKMVSFVLCTQGSFSVKVNLKEYTGSANDLFFILPENIIEPIQYSPDFKAKILLLSLDYLKNQSMHLPKNVSLYMYLRKYPLLSISNNEVRELHALAVVHKFLNENEPYRQEIISHLMCAFFYKIAGLIIRHTTEDMIHSAEPHNRQEVLLRNFLDLLEKYHRQERSITFYADQLYITPKYFSSVIRSISGRSPGEWISDSVIREAKSMLRFSTMSVQEIAYSLNFSSQTFFGKYFKRLTGITPGEFRAGEGE